MAKTNVMDAQMLCDSANQECQRLGELYEKSNIFAKAKIMLRLIKASTKAVDAKYALELAKQEQK